MREMKDSGVSWIGLIPKEWTIAKVKRFYKFGTGFTPPSKNSEYYDNEKGHIWANISDLNSGVIVDSSNKISDLYIKEYNPNIVPKGSLLYSFKLSVGKMAFAGCDLYTNEAIGSFYTSETNNLDYFKYTLFTIGMNASVNIYGANLLNSTLINNAITIFPPLEEQRKIANYLDDKCSKIDEILEKEQSVIEKLKEYKQAIITEAVTKGLDSNVEMKDSGMEWVGDIPKDCKVSKVKYFFDIILGKMLTTKQKNSDDTLEKYFSAMNVHFDNLSYITEKKMWFSEKEKEQYRVKKGDLLIVEGGAAGTCHIVEVDIENMYIQNSILITRPMNNISNKWLYYCLFSMVNRGYIEYSCNKATIPHFTKEKLSNTPIVIMPNEAEIIEFLDKKTSAIDETISKKEKIIEKLTEYKKSLIYEVVTGKKEV